MKAGFLVEFGVFHSCSLPMYGQKSNPYKGARAGSMEQRHRDVLRTIDRMRSSSRPLIAEHYRLNFEPVDFLDAKGERRPMYRMTANGLSDLAMSFSGDDAREVRIRFLNAFEEVAARLMRAERSITERLLELERREMPSVVRGQVGSRLMHDRRKDKPVFAQERATLQALAQPALPLFH